MQQEEKKENKQEDKNKVDEDNISDNNLKDGADGSNLKDNIRTKSFDCTHGIDKDDTDISIRNRDPRTRIQDSDVINVSVKPKIEQKPNDNIVSCDHSIPDAKPIPSSTRSGIGTIFKNISERRLRARNNLNPTLMTKSQREQLEENVRNDDGGMRRMESDITTGNEKGGRFKLKLKERFSQLSTAVLAPRAAIDKMIDPEDGEENLGFYRNVVVLREDGIDP